tara:strand:+ start:343 stop:921 length:579 start_codon:yes stop_codon:yes gene_type:complete
MHTRQEETKQYTCPDCERKYAVRDRIITGTLSREQLRMRQGRREGVCHCGRKFPSEFDDTRNVKWRMAIGELEAEPVFTRCTLPRVPSATRSTDESHQFRETRERMRTDPEFADSVLATAERACERMLESSLKAVRDDAARRLVGIRNAREALPTRIPKRTETTLDSPSEGAPKKATIAIDRDGLAVTEAVA